MGRKKAGLGGKNVEAGRPMGRSRYSGDRRAEAQPGAAAVMKGEKLFMKRNWEVVEIK